MRQKGIRPKALISLAIVGAAIVAISAQTSLFKTARAYRGRSQGAEVVGSKIPIARMSEAEPADPAQRELRIARSHRFDKLHLKRFDELRPGTKEVTMVTHFWQAIPGLPAGQSDAVVIGKVGSASAYTSLDKTDVYTEYVVQIEEILKNDQVHGLATGGSLIAVREGGGVELADQRVVIYATDQGRLNVGGKYVLFLKYNEGGQDYSVLTGYKLHGGHTQALDDSIDKFSIYDGVAQSRFLDVVREAIVDPPKSPEEIRRPNQSELMQRKRPGLYASVFQ